MNKSRNPQAPKPLKPKTPGTPISVKSPPPQEAGRKPTVQSAPLSSSIPTTPAETSGRVPFARSEPSADDDVRRVGVSATGDLGTFIEFKDALWKVAYSGPVFFSNTEETFIGLIACTSTDKARNNSMDHVPIGNCNGTVDNVAYFVCEENRGLLLPKAEVLRAQQQSGSTTPTKTPSLPQQPQTDELDCSLSGLVAGTQSIRRLRDESPAAMSINSYSTPTLKPGKQTTTRDVGCETDAFLLDDMVTKMVDKPCQDWVKGGVTESDVHQYVSQLYQPLAASSRRIMEQLRPFLATEKEWLDERRRHCGEMDEAFSWEDIILQQPLFVPKCLGQTATIRSDAENGGIADGWNGSWGSRERFHRLHAQLEAVRVALQSIVSSAPLAANVPEVVQNGIANVCNGVASSALADVRMALRPVEVYTELPETNVTPNYVVPSDSSVPQKDGQRSTVEMNFANRMKEMEHAREQFRRLAFNIESLTQEADKAIAEGRVDALETLGHAKVDTAQAMQRLSCDLVEHFPSLQDVYVEVPRKKFREALSAVRKDLPNVQVKLVERCNELATEAAQHRKHMLDLKERFIRKAYESSADINEAVRIVSAASQNERDLHEQLHNLIDQLVASRVETFRAMNVLNDAVTARETLFRDYHHDAANGELMTLVHQEKEGILTTAANVAGHLLISMDRLSEDEEASLMTLQRRLFEMQSEAHDQHNASYREVCLATEDLAHRKEQAHRVICDRLDRCTAELEIAMDGTDDVGNTRGIARERNELERVAKELFGDIAAVRAVGLSSGGVFEERSLPFLIKCGKQYNDPMIEAKKITECRALRLLGITQELRAVEDEGEQG